MCISPLKRTWAAWLYDLLKPHVSEVVVCNPRKNALPKDGSKSDRIDARKLAELLRGNHLKPVYHGEQGLRTLKELARSYLNISKDVTRVMNRLKGHCVCRHQSVCTTLPLGIVKFQEILYVLLSGHPLQFVFRSISRTRVVQK